ncbi:MAG: glucosaminidase domain-containing protein, partial [Alistipes sp.]|nr:glucosaminidase domain-containing protein [Alistipes sp.]
MNFINKSILSTAFLTLAIAFMATAQERQTKQEYIDRYKSLAVAHMEHYGIPASIIMAQGILESDSGNSSLARRSNNHFGIKCKSNWTGERVFHDDDEKGECFRKYATVEESYIDHSEFLDKQPRYDSLFVYSSTDYRSWARGLKAAGYATAPDYAERLIRIIEDNRLDLLDCEDGERRYDDYVAGVFDIVVTEPLDSRMPEIAPDTQAAASHRTSHSKRDSAAADDCMTAHNTGTIDPDTFRVTINSHRGYNVYMANTAHYVVAKGGDTYQSIGRLFDISAATLRRFNDVDKTAEPSEGDIVYIDRKLARWNGSTTLHVVSRGETLPSLAQWYG